MKIDGDVGFVTSPSFILQLIYGQRKLSMAQDQLSGLSRLHLSPEISNESTAACSGVRWSQPTYLWLYNWHNKWSSSRRHGSCRRMRQNALMLPRHTVGKGKVALRFRADERIDGHLLMLNSPPTPPTPRPSVPHKGPQTWFVHCRNECFVHGAFAVAFLMSFKLPHKKQKTCLLTAGVQGWAGRPDPGPADQGQQPHRSPGPEADCWPGDGELLGRSRSPDFTHQWVCVCVCQSFWPHCYSARPPSMCFMQVEYPHCQMLNCQTLVTPNNPESAEKAESSRLHSSLSGFQLGSPHDRGFSNTFRQCAKLIMIA